MSASGNLFFSNEALARMLAAHGRKVEKVLCHLWQNITNRETPLEIIDNVELYFEDKTRLTISCNPDGNGVDAIAYDFELARKELEEEFSGKIRLFSVDASTTKMWKDVIGKTLEGVRLTRNGDYYNADALVLDFGEEKREICIAPTDGLVIDYFEE